MAMPFETKRLQSLIDQANRNLAGTVAYSADDDTYSTLRTTTPDTSPTDRSGYYVSAATEPVLELLKPGEAWVVENRYGSEVLVSRGEWGLPMVDVDVVDVEGRLIDDFEARLKRLGLHRHMLLRCYRTAEGWRLLVVSETLEPDGPLFELLHNGMGGDERYLKLCQQQGTYRARLTRKPWRRFPPGSADCVCQFFTTIGQGQPDEALMGLVDYHDRRTVAHNDGWPLA
jgi:hypothetical protein